MRRPTPLPGGGYPNSQFHSNAGKLALTRTTSHAQGNLGVTVEGYAVPSGLPGLVWWGNTSTSPNTTTNGASVSSYTDTHAAYDVLTNTGANRPTYSTTGLGGQPCLVFSQASSQQLDGSASPAFGRSLIMACQITTGGVPTDNATPYQNAALWADHSFGYTGLYVRSSGKIQFYWYDAVGAAGWATFCIEASFTFDVPLVIVAHLRGNLLTAPWGFAELQVNNGTKVVSASVIRMRNSIQTPMRLARGDDATSTLDCKIGDHYALFNNNTEEAFEATSVARAREFLRNKYGAW